MRIEIVDTCLLTSRKADTGQALPLTSFCLLYIEKCSGFLTVNDIKQALTKKVVFLLHPGTTFSIESKEETELCVYCISFELYQEASRTERTIVYEKMQTFPVEGMVAHHRSAIGKLVVDVYEKDAAYIKQRAAAELLHWLSDQASAVQLESNEEGIQKTLGYMSESFAEPITLDDLAKIAGMNPAYYSHLFKQKMNKTPIEWLAHIRLNKAKELFLTETMKIKEVARCTGYQDEHYFSRRFKKAFGIAPSQYSVTRIQKVISLSYPYTDHLLALGVTPAAAQLQNSFDTHIKQLTLPYHAHEPWDIQRQFFLEQEPDIILCKNNVARQAKKYIGDIAPIVSLDWTSMDVYQHAEAIARLLGKEEALGQWHTAHNEKVKDARTKVDSCIEKKRSAVILSVTDKGLRLYGARNMGHVFYRLLGFEPPVQLQEKMNNHRIGTEFTWLATSIQEIRKDTSDYLFVVTQNEQHRQQFQAEIRKDPLLSAHPAIQNERCFYLEWQKWIVYAPLAIERQLDEAIVHLAKLD